MENENPKADRYAGDAAWSAWFDLCSVARCGADDAAPLSEQIRTAMFAQLARSGYPAAIVGDDDLVTFFDAYFMAAGTRDRDKPLKSYFRHRMVAERRPLREFVCGTLFSARFGRIHDIVRDWIASVKGWKPHSLVGPDGKRHVVWESAAAKDDVREAAGGYAANPGARLDYGVLRRYVAEMLGAVAAKIKVERRQVAFLLDATAKGLAISSPEVLAALGVRKSRANKIKEECMKQAARFFRDKEVDTSDLAFARAMITVCEEEVRHD